MPWLAPPAKLCSLCNGKVYPVEELYVDTVLYHRNCFRCQTCNKVLSLSEYASHRISSTAVALFCKPHFRQSFLERGRYADLAAEPNAAPPSPAAAGASPYRPSGIALFSEDEEAHTPPPPPKRKETNKTPQDFESGFEPEYKPKGVNRLDATKCAKCGTKVFPVFKLQAADSVWHVDCFRCATCNCQLSASAYAAGPEGEPVCLKHASKDARLSSLA